MLTLSGSWMLGGWRACTEVEAAGLERKLE